jgi:hypothetical protein
VRFQSVGRLASLKANQARTRDAKSVNMCPASAMSASDPDTMPPKTSANMKLPVNIAAIAIFRSFFDV